MFVSSDTGEDNVVLFSPLESINRRYFDVLVEFRMQRSVELHELDEIGALAFVGRDDSDLLWLDSRFEQSCRDLFHDSCFRSVQIRSTTGGDFFLPMTFVEKHRLVRNGPVEATRGTVCWIDAVLQRAFVKHGRWKLRERRVHSVLHLKSNGPYSQNDKAFKERLAKTSISCFFAHDNWAKLAMISDENDLLRAKNDRNHALWFSSLSRFIDQNRSESKFSKSRIASADASCANDISIEQEILFSLSSEGSITLFVVWGKFAHFALELAEFSELALLVQILDLVME